MHQRLNANTKSNASLTRPFKTADKTKIFGCERWWGGEGRGEWRTTKKDGETGDASVKTGIQTTSN
jgi:hypothetical protein